MLKGPLENQVEIQIRSLTGFDFQYTILLILNGYYGIENVQDIRKTHDQGADALVIDNKDKICIACYGPGNINPKKEYSAFKKKAEDDYKIYLQHWKATHPYWRMFTNKEPSPNQIKLIEGLCTENTTSLWGIDRILFLINKMSWGKKCEIFEKLQVDRELWGRDFIKIFLDDLSKQDPKTNFDYKKTAPDLIKKIKANLDEKNIHAMTKLIELTINEQLLIEECLEAYNEIDTQRIKGRVFNDFEALPSSLPFYERIKLLMNNYGNKYNTSLDDGITLFIQGIVATLFSQCIIGQEPTESN